MSDWYVLQSKVRHEVVAERNLCNQAFNTFLPLLKVKRQMRGRGQSVCEPMFPGYLFVELDLDTQNIAPIRSTRGVVRLVRLGAALQPFPESLLQVLMRAQTASGEVIDPSSMYETGDEVRLISGPMSGLKAIFKARNSQERVILLLNFLGSGTQISVSPHDIAKAG